MMAVLNIDLADINFLSTAEDNNMDEFHDAPISNNIQSNE